MRFLNIQTCKQLFEIGSYEDAITSATFCPKGHHIVAVMDSGALKIYDVRSLSPEISKVNSFFQPSVATEYFFFLKIKTRIVFVATPAFVETGN